MDIICTFLKKSLLLGHFWIPILPQVQIMRLFTPATQIQMVSMEIMAEQTTTASIMVRLERRIMMSAALAIWLI